MPHILSEMLDKIDMMAGDASAGALIDLRVAVVAGDASLSGFGNHTRMHAKLNEIQTWLVDNSTSSLGAADTVTGYTGELDALM
jgi:hypothetical protein